MGITVTTGAGDTIQLPVLAEFRMGRFKSTIDLAADAVGNSYDIELTDDDLSFRVDYGLHSAEAAG